MAVVSNFLIDYEWLAGECPALVWTTSRGYLQTVLADGMGEKDPAAEVFFPRSVRLQPAMLAEPYKRGGVHHHKWILLAYEHGLRLIITTAKCAFRV